MRYTLTVHGGFSAAHRLFGSGGKCEGIHGHNFKVQLTVGGDELGESGMLIDFTVLKAALSEILEELDHTDLNEHAAFKGSSPSSENIARYIWNSTTEKIKDGTVSVLSVTVNESETASATYKP